METKNAIEYARSLLKDNSVLGVKISDLSSKFSLSEAQSSKVLSTLLSESLSEFKFVFRAESERDGLVSVSTFHTEMPDFLALFNREYTHLALVAVMNKDVSLPLSAIISFLSEDGIVQNRRVVVKRVESKLENSIQAIKLEDTKKPMKKATKVIDDEEEERRPSSSQPVTKTRMVKKEKTFMENGYMVKRIVEEPEECVISPVKNMPQKTVKSTNKNSSILNFVKRHK